MYQQKLLVVFFFLKSHTITRRIAFFGGYFSSEWSFSWYKGPECPSICCFGQDIKSNTIIGMLALLLYFFLNRSLSHFPLVYTADGSYIKITFDPKKGGECVRKSFTKYYKKKDAENKK